MLFAKPTALQADLYDQVLNSNLLKRSLEGSNETGHLRAISVLKKIVNCPTLLASTAENENENDEDEATGGSDGFFGDVKGALAVLHGHEPYSRDWIAVCSGKLALLDSLVSNLFEGTDEKIVIVSMSTQSLDILEQLCRTRSWPLVRLDGSTATTKRQPIIDRFNGKDHPERILLLSSKSGGAGLNVVGASRMILFDLSVGFANSRVAGLRLRCG